MLENFKVNSNGNEFIFQSNFIIANDILKELGFFTDDWLALLPKENTWIKQRGRKDYFRTLQYVRLDKGK